MEAGRRGESLLSWSGKRTRRIRHPDFREPLFLGARLLRSVLLATRHFLQWARPVTRPSAASADPFTGLNDQIARDRAGRPVTGFQRSARGHGHRFKAGHRSRDPVPRPLWPFVGASLARQAGRGVARANLADRSDRLVRSTSWRQTYNDQGRCFFTGTPLQACKHCPIFTSPAERGREGSAREAPASVL